MKLYSIAAGLAALPLAFGITPKQMLAAPRRSDLTPNPSGEWAVFTETSFSWETEKSKTTWRLLNIQTGNITDLRLSASDVSEIVWVGPTNTSILYINGTNDEVAGGVTLWTTDLSDSSSSAQKTLVASLPAAFSGLKAIATSTGINFLVNALAYPNGTVYNEELEKQPSNSGRLYSSIFVRHWDSYITHQRYAVFSGSLVSTNSSLKLDGALKNLLTGFEGAVTRPESPVQPFGDLGDYDLSPDGQKVIFLTKAPELPKSNYTTSYIYLIPHDGSAAAVAINGPNSTAPQAAKGASANPRFAPNGSYVAYLQMDGFNYESDRNKIYVADITSTPARITLVAGDWDRSPSSLTWSLDGSTLVTVTEDIGVARVIPVPANAAANYKPTNLTDTYSSVTSISILPDESILASSSSFFSSKNYFTVDSSGSKKFLFTANTVDPELAGLDQSELDFFWYEGTLGVQQQSWVVKPTGFQPDKKYPLAFIVHGGPQVLQPNAWSTRWNAKVWADQGYVVVLPNPTGSPSYGQKLVDDIQNNWGSYPYEDLINAWEYVAANLSYVDVERGIEAGASFGGFMTNWIQGHDFGRKFKALVTHDGTASALGKYATDELWFIEHDFAGNLWDNRENYERFDPILHAKNFSTPHFIVHNDLDYRLSVSEGIMFFNVLQERGVPSRFLNFPDENHHVLKRQNSLVWHTEIFNWINYYSGITDTLVDNTIGN